MAETQGFEPWVPLTGYDDLANRCLQPLGHVSVMRHLASSFLKGNANREKGSQPLWKKCLYYQPPVAGRRPVKQKSPLLTEA